MGVKEILRGLANGFYYFGRGYSMCRMYPNLDCRLLNDKEALDSDARELAGDGRIAMSRFEKEILKPKK